MQRGGYEEHREHEAGTDKETDGAKGFIAFEGTGDEVTA